MPTVHSHYENLKVARDAAHAEIRAAYRSLTQKYHPDRNPGNAEAERIMSVVNVAYQVLANPVTRAEHDAWIAQSEHEGDGPRVHGLTRLRPASVRAAAYTINEASFRPPPPLTPGPEIVARRRRRLAAQARLVNHLRRFWIGYALAGMIGLGALINDVVLAPSVPNLPYTAAAANGTGGAATLSATGAYARPATAPNGQPWPEQSAYLTGYPMQNAKGLSEVKIDNSENGADMFAKLYSLDGPQPQAVRVFLVRAHSKFTLAKVTPGTYDLRYRNLDDGRLARSQFFTVEEVPTATGTRVSSVTLTLYDARNGNLQNFGLAEGEF